MARPRIALYGAGGAPYNHAAVFARAGYEVDFVFPQDVLSGALAGFDAFVMPGGGYRAMVGQIEPLGREGARALREYVEAGGMYIGCCAGSYDAATVAKSFLALCPAQEEMCLSGATVWNDGGEEWGLRSPGIGVLRAETVAAQHPVMAGMPATFEIAHYNGPLFSGATPLARVVGRTERFTPWEEMLGRPAERTLVDDAVADGVANIVGGRGRRRASRPLRLASRVRVHDRDGGRAAAGAHAPQRRRVAARRERQPRAARGRALHASQTRRRGGCRPGPRGRARGRAARAHHPHPRARRGRALARTGLRDVVLRPVPARDLEAVARRDRPALDRGRAARSPHRAARPLLPCAGRVEPRRRLPRRRRAARTSRSRCSTRRSRRGTSTRASRRRTRTSTWRRAPTTSWRARTSRPSAASPRPPCSAARINECRLEHRPPLRDALRRHRGRPGRGGRGRRGRRQDRGRAGPAART